MRPRFHPFLVNDPFGDPALYVEFLFERRALLFDLGELAALSNRKLLRLSHIFISHTHMDHFVGLDRLVRVMLGRDKCLELYGPPGLIAQVGHKLAAYSWNLVHNYATDFTLGVTEADEAGNARRAEFHCQRAFVREAESAFTLDDGLLLDEPGLRVRTRTLDHRIPSLAFALEEARHVNVWKNRLQALGLPVGPWLRELKAAVLRGEPPERPFSVRWREGEKEVVQQFELGELQAQVLRIVPGQKLVYVADAAGHAANAERIVELARGADLLYIEAAFLRRDEAAARRTHHLTAHEAGRLARLAGVKKVIPFHFSSRYNHQAGELQAELQAAFSGEG